MSILELEQLVIIPDIFPECPVKVIDHEELSAFAPIPPELVTEDDRLPRSRFWQYRVCGLPS